MPDCIIVGGGIIGLLTARQLFLQGVDVLLLEKGPLGGESSWAGGGIISPLYPWRYGDAVNVLAQRSKIIYPQLTEKLLDESGVDCELINSGLFTVVDSDFSQHPEISDWAKKWSVDIRYIDDKKMIQQIENAAGEVVDKGVWMPDVLQIRNPKLVAALKVSFEHHAIPYCEYCEVEEILTEKDKITGVRTKNKTYPSKKVIIASGAWSAKFSVTKSSVNVSPVKGQMIMYKGAPDLVKRIILSEGHYIIPRKDGRILAGSTLEKIGFDKSISSSALDELHHAAVQLVPLLADLEIERQWAGLRPGTVKGIPYVCKHDDMEGLYVHAGHFRNGIVLGAASADLMVDIVLDRAPWCDPAPYALQAEH